MLKQAQQRQLLELFAQEQASAHEKITQWRQWCHELCELGDPRFGEMGMWLEQIRDDLHKHFTHEEQSGCLSEIAKRHPELSDRISQLEAQHQSLLDDLNRMIERLEACQPGYCCWGEARTAFESFLDRLESHEREEIAVLDQWRRA